MNNNSLLNQTKKNHLIDSIIFLSFYVKRKMVYFVLFNEMEEVRHMDGQLYLNYKGDSNAIVFAFKMRI